MIDFDKYYYVDKSVPELYKIQKYWRNNLFEHTPRFGNREYGIFITFKYKRKKYVFVGIAVDELDPYVPITDKVTDLMRNIGCTDIDVVLERGIND